MLFCNCHHGRQLTGTHSILCHYVVCLVILTLWSRCTLPRLCRLFHLHCCRCINSRWESPFGKGWVDHNPYGHYHLPRRREERAWVECTLREFLICFVVVVVLSIVIWKRLLGWDGLVVNPMGNIIFLADGRSGCGWSVLGSISLCQRCGPRRRCAGSLGQI